MSTGDAFGCVKRKRCTKATSLLTELRNISEIPVVREPTPAIVAGRGPAPGPSDQGEPLMELK
jgi:hypothetical protein